MTSDRMMQAMNRIERALSRIEQHVCAPPPAPVAEADGTFDREEAQDALRALDGLITELKEKAHG